MVYIFLVNGKLMKGATCKLIQKAIRMEKIERIIKRPRKHKCNAAELSHFTFVRISPEYNQQSGIQQCMEHFQ